VKLAVIFHRFGPYHFARLEAAARHGEVAGIELGAETREYQWTKVEETAGFRRITLFPEGDSRLSPTHELEKRMRNALSASVPDVVAIPGWSEKGALLALQWCVENKIPVVLMSESTATDEPRVWWKESVKRRIVALCSSALVGGERHREYLSDLGMPRDRVFIGYDAVDNERFADAKRVIGYQLLEETGEDGDQKLEDRGRRSEVRRKYGLPDNYFLASARFIPKKNLAALIRAYAEYRKKVGSGKSKVEVWSLVILGDGPLRSDLCSLISRLGLESYVVMPGFKQYDELPVYYALANAFVHASSSEQWGLVVNEALASGLPVIVSNRCGCVPELVKDGINGFTFDPGDQEQLTSRLLEMASFSQERREELGKAGSRIVAEFGPERFADGLLRAAESAVELGPRKPTVFQRVLLQSQLRR
jgi:glycosyltransferase involved in cell wall biosynthesis